MKTQVDCYKALMEGKKLRKKSWWKKAYIHIKHGNILNSYDMKLSYDFQTPNEWEIVK